MSIDNIDRYILGDMNQDEIQHFENELRNSKKMRSELIRRGRIMNAAVAIGRKELKRELKGIHTKLNNSTIARKETPSNSILTKRRFLQVAASMIFMAGIVYWILQAKSSIHEDVFSSFYERYELLSTVRGEAEDSIFREAINLYNKGKNKELIPLIETIMMETKSLDNQWLIALSVSYFEIGEMEKALQTLKIIIDKKDVFLEDKAKWYSALFHIKSGDISKATFFLNELAGDSAADKHTKAKQVLTHINSYK